MDSCAGCEVVSGAVQPPGGVLWRGEGFVLHAVMGPTPVPGWLVLTSERHCRAVYSLEEGESAALGRLSARFARALMATLGAEHVYLFAIGDVLAHCHLHLVPRYADTPAHYRGRGAFELRGVADALGAEVVAAAARRVVESDATF